MEPRLWIAAQVSLYSINTSGWDLAEWLEGFTANAEVAIGLGSIPASTDTGESEGRQMKQYIEEKKITLLN
jgi:hypothetical protein